MKKIYLLIFCLGLNATLFSQRKAEFGFVAKAGNYTIPGNGSATDAHSSDLSTSGSQGAGSQYVLGLWHSFPLGTRFSISGELLYRNAFWDSKEHFHSSGFEGSFRTDQVQKINEGSLALPIRLHYLFKKGGKSSIAIGGGFSRIFSTSIYTEVKSQFEPNPETSSNYTVRFSELSNFDFSTNLTAGFYHRLGTKTSIGLEYTFQKTAGVYQQYPNVFLNPLVDCFCLYIEQENRPDMHSFSVSLRHNILD